MRPACSIKKLILTYSRSLRLTLLIPLLAFTMGINSTQAQESDYKTTFTDAEYYFLFNDFQEALPLYQKALELSPDNSNLLYRIGRCYLNIPGVKHKAIEYFEKAARNINASHQEGSYKEKGAPQITYFYLGEAYRISERFDDAIETYTIFRDLLNPRDVYNFDYVDQQIKACERARNMKELPLNIELEPLNLFESSRYINCPSASYDGNFLLFTVQEKFYDAVYISKKNDQGDWGTPENISLDLGVEGEIYTTSINYDGTELFLYRNDRGVGNIYTSKKVDGRWQKIQKLGRRISSRYWETCATISPDGGTLYFASSRTGGFGGLDLYYSKRLPDGEWGEPTNFGSTINTPHNEENPHLSPDGQTLYFVSQGHNSMGGYDIFYSELIGENEWSIPTNMGYPINSTDDDMSFFPLGKNKALVSIVEKGKPNVRGIFQLTISPTVEVVEIKIAGVISLANSYEVQDNQLKISLLDAKTKDTIQTTNPMGGSGKYSLNSKAGAYRVVVEGKGYTTASVPVSISSNYSNPEYPLNITLIPEKVTSGEYLVIRSILFEFDKAELSREAQVELEKLFNIMNKNPSVSIEVTGHTDNIGSLAYNQKLSLKRAESAINYLIEKGIETDRLLARGASDFENIASNYKEDGTDNPEGRSLNRRASIKVLKGDLKITIASEVNIPEHLKPREQSYTIILAPVNTNVNKNNLNSLNKLSELESKKLTGLNNKFAYTIGSYAHKSLAIELLNTAIDNGFPMATIFGEDDLNILIGRPLEVFVSQPKEEDNIYTIQILASKEQVTNSDKFRGIEVNEVKGDDGIFRYIYGRFFGKNAALKELEIIKTKGFNEAFVMNINRYN